MAAEMLGSALVQEAVSRVSSFVFSKREERAPLEHIVERLEMALSELEFTLERSAKLPITDVALLRRRKLFKRAYEEASDVLNKHKPPSVKASEDQAQDRGVEAVLSYLFEDRETPPGGGRGFQLVLALRLSESTDIAGSSADEGMGARDRILELAAAVAPHGQWDDDGLQEGYALEIIGGREERRNGSMQEIAGVAKVRNGKCDWKSQGKQHQQAAGWKEEAAVEV
ncbi:hypothetical protein PR202_ga28222 [Eleusine coracana subsp. coracana]|uniref:Rx N-terminal domain-containing protein n=1 Tax=Eleusine coracana subsp. coracana TaxID=191504 RepID=A0AAV5DGU3_ELECO|nr:hypothetical protein PR202_ga28222 [Eleusine coracana subsp. coracana]